MCNRYTPPDWADIERFWHVGRQNAIVWPQEIFPRAPGQFIRRARDDSGYARELVVGQWGLVPWFAEEVKLKFSTNNARAEELADKATFKDPWKRGQRCIIPAAAFDEPNRETGLNVWWRFRRADGARWGLAGLWNTWTDRTTGEQHESYAMLTLNADIHALMSRMHKPDPKLEPHRQDKRSSSVICDSSRPLMKGASPVRQGDGFSGISLGPAIRSVPSPKWAGAFALLNAAQGLPVIHLAAPSRDSASRPSTKPTKDQKPVLGRPMISIDSSTENPNRPANQESKLASRDSGKIIPCLTPEKDP